MDTSNLSMRASSPPTTEGGSAYLPNVPILDANALQAAYLAIQMQNQMQQNQQQAAAANAAAAAAFPLLATLPPSAASEAERLLAQAALAEAHITPSVPPAFQDSSSASRHSLSPPRQTSAFSPIRAIGNPITATAPSRPQYAPPPSPLDMMLLQMQMAAAAVGLVQSPFSLLPSTSAFGLLAPHLRLQPPVSGFGSLPLTANTSTSLAQLVPNIAVTSQADLKAETSGMNTCGNNLLTGRPSTSLPGSPSKANESSPNPLPRCYSMDKQQKSSLKRPYSDMTVLRSLCNDTDTPDATSMVKKRARDDENEQDRRLLAAEVMTTISLKENHSQNRYQSDDILAAASQHFTNKVNANSCDESLSQPIGIITPTTSSGVTHVPSGDPNSPNRHHPLNHRPPAMEARFLECMAAIALHSNFSLPISTPSDEKEDDSNESQSSDTEKPPSNGEATIETEVETEPPAQPEACATNENEDVVVTCDASDVQEEEDDIVPQEDSKPDHADRTDDLTERLMHKSERKTWPTTAIDEELCKELENYKGTDVPMIHAYVIPSRSDTSSASGDTPDERGESPPFHSVPSLAVPVPILNILLERILHTMLQT